MCAWMVGKSKEEIFVIRELGEHVDYGVKGS
jgi:hypothetical protein